jgi:hypothetical protein
LAVLWVVDAVACGATLQDHRSGLDEGIINPTDHSLGSKSEFVLSGFQLIAGWLLA